MPSEILPVAKVELDGRTRDFLKRDIAPGLKIVVGIDSVLYGGCCGGYEEKSLKIEAVENIDDSTCPEFVYLSDTPTVYIHRDLLPLLKLKGNHLIISTDSNGSLCCNLDLTDIQDRFQRVS